MISSGRSLVIRIGALGDVLLTRRLTYSLSLSGLRSTLFAPARHAALLLQDSWIDAVLDSESEAMAGVFSGVWPSGRPVFDVAIVISNSDDLAASAQAAATSLLRISPASTSDEVSIASQWALAASRFSTPFDLALPYLPTDPFRARAIGATFIHPGSGSKHKNWPIERFVAVASALRSEGHHVVWVRGPAEEAFTVAASGFDVLDQPTLRDLAATLAHSRLVIGNDSGVSHLAGAVGAPSIAIYGPTSDRVWRPDGAQVHTIRAPSGELAAVLVEKVLAVCGELTGLARKDAS